MNQLILVKYAPEIFLKGLNRNKFERKLRDNIKKKLKDIDFQMVVDQGRHFIKTENIDEVQKESERFLEFRSLHSFTSGKQYGELLKKRL